MGNAETMSLIENLAARGRMRPLLPREVPDDANAAEVERRKAEVSSGIRASRGELPAAEVEESRGGRNDKVVRARCPKCYRIVDKSGECYSCPPPAAKPPGHSADSVRDMLAAPLVESDPICPVHQTKLRQDGRCGHCDAAAGLTQDRGRPGAVTVSVGACPKCGRSYGKKRRCYTCQPMKPNRDAFAGACGSPPPVIPASRPATVPEPVVEDLPDESDWVDESADAAIAWSDATEGDDGPKDEPGPRGVEVVSARVRARVDFVASSDNPIRREAAAIAMISDAVAGLSPRAVGRVLAYVRECLEDYGGGS